MVTLLNEIASLLVIQSIEGQIKVFVAMLAIVTLSPSIIAVSTHFGSTLLSIFTFLSSNDNMCVLLVLFLGLLSHSSLC